MAKKRRRTRKKRTQRSRRQVKRIDVLPDDALLEIFDFYVVILMSRVYHAYTTKRCIEAWQSLVHVCRRWRTLVLGSPRRLNLQLYCTPETPARGTLDVWPALPLFVIGDMGSSGTDNIIAALGQSNNVCDVDLRGLAGRKLEEVLAAMQVPFPELTNLKLFSNGKTVPVIPDSFLDGSAPRLQHFELSGIPFPGLPQLQLSANHLVSLRLINIPDSGYISPEAIVALLSELSSLRELMLLFQSPQSRPHRETRLPPPSKCFVIPALAYFYFKGVTEYLEDLVTFIDTPQLDNVDITFFNQIDFDCPRLAQFINRTPTLRARDIAYVEFHDGSTSVALLASWFKALKISISCAEQDRQLSSIAHVCNSFLLSPSMVENLYIGRLHWPVVRKNDPIEDTLWLELLLPFTLVKNLYLSREFAPGIAATLQELVGSGITEVLPNLQNIFAERPRAEPWGPLQEKIEQFAAARRHSGHPIAISVWHRWM